MKEFIPRTLTAVFVLLVSSLAGQQVPDTAFTFENKFPKYAPGQGPVVRLDEAHYNFHTLAGRYAGFGKTARQDGYRVEPHTKPFTAESLAGCRVLVIANALDSTVGSSFQWRLPNPSAFTSAEIRALRAWVQGGGRLLLIADHMPFAGAAQELGRAFGFEFLNCFAMDNRRRGTERFYRGYGLQAEHPVVRGRRSEGRVDTVVTFTGSAFRLPKGAHPILSLNHYTLLMPETAWQFQENTPHRSAKGYFQGATLVYGKGRVAVFGEAAMFSAQLAGAARQPVGLNQPEARQNNQLLINVLHWLDE